MLQSSVKYLFPLLEEVLNNVSKSYNFRVSWSSHINDRWHMAQGPSSLRQETNTELFFFFCLRDNLGITVVGWSRGTMESNVWHLNFPRLSLFRCDRTSLWVLVLKFVWDSFHLHEIGLLFTNLSPNEDFYLFFFPQSHTLDRTRVNHSFLFSTFATPTCLSSFCFLLSSQQ